MSGTAYMVIIFLVVMLMALPLLIQFNIRGKTKNSHLCVIVEKGKPLSIKLLKFSGDDFVKDGEDGWMLKTNLMKPVAYPIGFPKMLSGFQQAVWCSLVMRGRSDPLDWENPPAGALSSKELPAILDPHWLVSLVKGVGEESKTGKYDKPLVMIAAGASVIALLMVFYVISKLGAIEQAVTSLRAIVG